MMCTKRTLWRILISVVAVCAVAAVCFLYRSSQGGFDIQITVPAGSQEYFVYSDEEISPTKSQIIISSGENLADTTVILKPIEVHQESAYDEPAYLTPGMPVKMDAEKGAWFQIGVSVQNPTDQDIVVSVHVKNIEVRIAGNASTSITH